jgi:hypothetical protein
MNVIIGEDYDGTAQLSQRSVERGTSWRSRVANHTELGILNCKLRQYRRCRVTGAIVNDDNLTGSRASSSRSEDCRERMP